MPLVVITNILHMLSLRRQLSGGARIVEQVGPAAGPKVVW